MPSSALLVLVALPFEPAPPPPGPPPPPPAAYQPYPRYGYGPPPPPTTFREGFMIGFGLGLGSMKLDDCSSCDALGGLGFDFHIGGMLSPTIGLMFEGFGITHPEENGTSTSQSTAACVLQWIVADRFWLKGGLGFGQYTLADDDGDIIAESDAGFAMTLAGGFELIQSGNFTFDVALRGVAVAYEDVGSTMGSVQLGLNWY